MEKASEESPININIDSYYSLFLITRLNYFILVILISIYNNYSRVNNIYYKASFIKVIDIYIYYTIFYLYILKKLELVSNKLRIFTKGPLKIINIIKIYL